MHSFSKALGVELKAYNHKVEALGIQAGSVQSQQNQADTSFFVPSSRAMARSAQVRIGCGRANVTAYFPHALQGFSFSVWPEWAVDKLFCGVFEASCGE